VYGLGRYPGAILALVVVNQTVLNKNILALSIDVITRGACRLLVFLEGEWCSINYTDFSLSSWRFYWSGFF